MAAGPGDSDGDKHQTSANAPNTQGNTQLPPQQHPSQKLAANNVQQNQEHSNPQTAQTQQTSQSIQQASPPQQQISPQTNAPPNPQQNIPEKSGQNIQNIQQPIQDCSPQVSPPQNNIQYIIQNPHQPQNQQMPQQPLLFQQQAGPNLILGPQQQFGQQHVILQHQMMQPQQHIILQTPILLSNNAQSSPVSMPVQRQQGGTGDVSPSKAIKKGRFRIFNPRAPAVNDNQSAASSTDTDNAAPQPASKPVKKGRFVVKKGASAVAENAAKGGKKPSRQGEPKGAKKTTNEKDATNGGRVAPSEQTKPTEPTVQGSENQSDNTSAPADTKPEAKDPCAKKKGRFLVKTKSTPTLAATGTKEGAEIASLGGGDPPKSASGTADQSTINGADHHRKSSTMSSKELDALAAASQISMKQKGRFTVKTGGAAANMPAGAGADATTGAVAESGRRQSVTTAASEAPLSTQPGPEGTQNAGIVQFTTNPPIPNFVAANIPFPLASLPATSFVDANGQVYVTVQQQIPAPQPQVQSQVENPPAQSAPSGSQPQPQQPPPNSTDLHKPIPLVRPRVMTDESVTSKKAAPSTNRPPGSSGSNWSFGCKSGRLIGTGGVGKALHFLDTLRSEVLEADRSIVSLQSDNKLLRDKNKELEAKNRDLERRLAEEKRLRLLAERKYRSLNEKASDHENKTQAGPGLHQQEVEPPIPPPNDSPGKPAKAPENNVDRSAATQQEVEPAPPPNGSPANPAKAIENDVDRVAQQQEVEPTPSSHEPTPAHSRQNSSQTCIVSPMTAPSFVANQFDPLGTAASSTFMPTLTSVDSENVAIPLIVTTTSTPTPVANIGDEARGTPNISNRTLNHFDPLGTPERTATTATLSAMVINGAPQLPAMATHNGNVTVPVILPLIHRHQQQQQQQQINQEEEDPFDEIVRNRLDF